MTRPVRPEIHITEEHHAAIVGHARRKLLGHYEPSETPERKAFGLLGGRSDGHRFRVTALFPLRVNLRGSGHYQDVMDEAVAHYAIPSETPAEQRGWVADPAELLEAENTFDALESVMFGSYHTHRVPWPDDPLRDTCTELDTRLAENSGMWSFIVSMVDPEQPRLRAFYEGRNDREATIRISPALSPHPKETSR
ncbi:hypothetical protein [Streptomyces sp. BA2]|uniref:hypothetical protein n=1 Tax=Streptomyces sp. BA2 TaxID=436595 RepID=UPI0013286F2D|nr:hypothetical protein [Streptomyces sp. BA2]MWA08913.1 hypothetical protein [Streptomyces sp. BA2]